MKARSVARELALLTLFQLEKKDSRLDWERLSLQELIVSTVRTLTDLAKEQLENTYQALAAVRDDIVDYEIGHPENENVPLDQPTKPVPIPTTQEMVEKLDTLLQSLEQLEFAVELPEIKALSEREDVRNYCNRLVKTVFRFQPEIDRLIDEAATDWRIERLQKMDRVLLCLAVAELRYTDSVDPATVINEALELAKRFTTEESRKFIHGILGAIAGMPSEVTENV